MLTSRLTVIGTIHVDVNSVELARKTVEEVRPEVVAVELCPTRFEYLMKGQNAKKSRWQIGSIGWWAYQLEKRVGEILDVFPGSEMVSAIKAAQKIGCRIALIDRPIAVTLQRIARVPLKEKLKLYLALVGAGVYLSIPGPKTIKFAEDTSAILSEFEKRFPHVFKVLVTERNEHMALMLNSILMSSQGEVVAIVGKGHQQGLIDLVKKWCE